MADEFRREMDMECDIGGVRCDCCNRYHGKDRRKLNKLARTRVKENTKKMVREEEKELPDSE
jgi:hypothetical protein